MAVTDSDGIYDIPDLPPGHYEVRVEGCGTNPELYMCDIETRSDLKEGEVFGREWQKGQD